MYLLALFHICPSVLPPQTRDYGLTSAAVPEALIKSFFKYWWGTPLNSPERKLVDFQVKRGPLAGRAVAIANNAGPACMGSTPLAKAAHKGSSLFVYNQKAVRPADGTVGDYCIAIPWPPWPGVAPPPVQGIAMRTQY